MKEYTKQDYEQERHTYYRGSRGGCGHLCSNLWCGVCRNAQPRFIARHMKEAILTEWEAEEIKEGN